MKSRAFGAELKRSNAPGEELDASTDTRSRWVSALTLGYGHQLYNFGDAELNAGVSFTSDFLPSSYKAAYGGNPVLGRIYLQIYGMKMWDL